MLVLNRGNKELGMLLFDYVSFSVSCRWKGTPCSHDDFQLTVTDAGVCYTFNSRISPNSTVDASGK